MSKTIQIRNVSDEVYAALARHAAEEGISVPALLRRQAVILALRLDENSPRLTMADWLERVTARPINTSITPDHILEALDEIRGPWPDSEAPPI